MCVLFNDAVSSWTLQKLICTGQWAGDVRSNAYGSFCKVYVLCVRFSVIVILYASKQTGGLSDFAKRSARMWTRLSNELYAIWLDWVCPGSRSKHVSVLVVLLIWVNIQHPYLPKFLKQHLWNPTDSHVMCLLGVLRLCNKESQKSV